MCIITDENDIVKSIALIPGDTTIPSNWHCYFPYTRKLPAVGDLFIVEDNPPLVACWHDARKENPPVGYVYTWGYFVWAGNPDGKLDDLPAKAYFDGVDYWNSGRDYKHIGIVCFWALKITPPTLV